MDLMFKMKIWMSSSQKGDQNQLKRNKKQQQQNKRLSLFEKRPLQK